MKRIDRVYLLLALGISFCMIFMNVNYDMEYQLSMAYRRFLGDQPITQMWEPHQTSVFLNVFLIRIFMKLTGTTTGIVVYMQAVGWLIRVLLAVGLFVCFRPVAGNRTAAFIMLFYLLMSPKEVMGPEFANMQLWFGTMLFLCLMKYFQSGHKRWVILAALSLCLEILSYPSCIVVYFAAVILLWRYSRPGKRKMAIGLFTGVCIVIGTIVAWHYFGGITPEVILKCLKSALAVEPTHTVSALEKSTAYLKNLLKIAAVLIGTACGGTAVYGLVRKISKKAQQDDKTPFCFREGLIYGWYGLLVYLVGNIIRADHRGGYVYLLLYLVVMGWQCIRFLADEAEKCMFYTALLIGGCEVLATLILSDNPFLQSVPYGLLAICGLLLPIMRYIEHRGQSGRGQSGRGQKAFYTGIYLFFALIMVRCVYIHIPIYGYSQICSLSSDLALIRRGPAMGIITDEEGAARQRDSLIEWEEYIEEGSKIWIVGGAVVDTLGYLYKPAIVAAPSTMADPTYGDELYYYWELNPDKYPDVVVVSAGFGELSYEVLNDPWLMNWLENEFRASRTVDGNYWRYYFR